MDLVQNLFNGGLLKIQWRRRRYQRLDGTARKNIKVTKFGRNGQKRTWRIKAIPKLKLKIFSPIKLWNKFKNAYMNMMLHLAGNVNNGNMFGAKRIPKARQVELAYTNTEFENRLIYEIYKSMVPSMELYPNL
ncbi:uncharacterized protein LOC132624677 [Lycium barbarum]|uniref:uncharacterized protein LOC132624677 n=1 Tax=Lycium barbarum TaxID=112863 RepID=UPI00293EEE89|nr:uncharacterized protein LOC132624677 [Lycium barbarum]